MTKKKGCIYKKNAFYIEVKECCRSCAMKELTRAKGTRWCRSKKQEMKPDEVCRYWRMSRQLRMAGFARGRVKRVEYLLYLAAVREDEGKAAEQGQEVTPLSIEEVRAQFEQQFGSIYEEL